ncbi:hypothetical protein MSAN_00418300 [Mycena sanguinolenta]|uniref:Uncharacterized protein n=1 Tax=Mycena sanguinolenta TaxID=230812 RepID=A0A8H6ZD64_9AGAR|nr:hypothetical protein MSAN_00418300 [Mycena sanguinolenta]
MAHMWGQLRAIDDLVRDACKGERFCFYCTLWVDERWTTADRQDGLPLLLSIAEEFLALTSTAIDCLSRGAGKQQRLELPPMLLSFDLRGG